nr:putative replication associated protein [Crucivirus sp.]
MCPEMDDNRRKFRRFRWTHNNYTAEDIARYSKPDKLHEWIDYITFSYEIGEKCGTPHLQGYIEFDRMQTIAQACDKMEPGKGKAKTSVPHGVRLMQADANRQANIVYVRKGRTKDPIYVDEAGNPLIFEWQKEGAQRTRGAGTGKEAWEAKLEHLKAEPNLLAFAGEYPEEAFKYSSGVEALCKAIGRTMTDDKLTGMYPMNLRLYKWQRAIANIVGRKDVLPEGRKVLWIYDPLGKCGKTVFAAWLMVNHKALYLNNAKSENMAHAWSKDRNDIIIIDLMKTTEDFVNYTAMEAGKNGIWFSPKYDSSTQVSIRPWVIVLSNSLPRLDAMAQERFLTIRIRDNPAGMELEDDPEGKLEKFNDSDRTGEFLGDPILGPMILGDEWHHHPSNPKRQG